MAPDEKSAERLARFLREEQRLQAELSQVIRQHIVQMPQANLGEWLEGLRLAFERLREHLARTYAAKEADGYLRMVTQLRPTLSRQVEEIQREHSEILHMAVRILSDLAETKADQKLLVADANARIQRFLAVIAQHEQKENMITLLVFNQDLGSDD